MSSFAFFRLYQLSKAGKLTVPAMNVNDSVTKVSNAVSKFNSIRLSLIIFKSMEIEKSSSLSYNF